MNVEGKILVDASVNEVWEALNNPNVLKAATPGCKSMEEVETNHYRADIVLGIAAVRGEYQADIHTLEKEAPEKYRLIMNADSPAGFIEGDAIVRLEEVDTKTNIMYEGTAKVGGLIAGVGQRVLSGISKKIVKDFFKKIAAAVKSEQEIK